MIILSFYSHTLDGGDFVSLLYKEVDDFEAYAYHQKQFKKITKKDLLGKWTLFFFYPADFTFVCPTELEDLQEKYQEFKKVNCEIYAISTDTHFAHKTWHDISENISKIEYPMIGDPTHSLTYDFDVFDENDGLAQRGSFIIDPEGKIVVYEGLMQLVSSDDELAVVVGHEVAHAVAKHSNERMSQQLMAQYGAQILGQALSNKSTAVQKIGASVYGLGAQYGVMLPFSRKHESEADYMGLVFMAMAGYNPAVAVNFWQKMSAGKSGSTPEFMSTHPSDATRINEIKQHLPEIEKYRVKK